ncbi:hypothetical protein [Paracoccus yeei]|uniref:hypothetical protein n=1 Tax=Paracoccus yeei TaxID=147645 RepID=UPI003BF7740A
MQSFADETNAFIECRSRELQEFQDAVAADQRQAGEQYEDAVRYWNCKANREPLCF